MCRESEKEIEKGKREETDRKRKIYFLLSDKYENDRNRKRERDGRDEKRQGN